MLGCPSRENSQSTSNLCRRDHFQLLLQSSKVPLHRTLGKLGPGHHWVLFQRPLDQRVLAGLVKVRNAVSVAKIIPRLTRRLNPVESRLEPIIRPRHEQVPDVTNDLACLRLHLGPFVSNAELSHGFPTGTNLQPTLPFFLKQ